MKRGIINPKLEYYYPIVEEIAGVMLAKMSNKLFFKAKLDNTKVTISETDELSTGVCDAKNENELEIILNINPKQEKEFIELIVAHELAHLLLAVFNPFADYSITDNSYSISGVKRISDEIVYGCQVEESLCDWIAIDVIYKLHNSKISKERLKEIFCIEDERWRATKKSLDLIHKLIETFSEDGNAEFEYYDMLLTTEEEVFPKNQFLYSSCNGHLSSFITEYDQSHGKGAWKRLNENLDIYLYDNSDTVILKRVERMLENYAETKVSKF